MSSLQNKLYNYEQSPPENAWDKIAAALDQNGFASKLYNYEQAPPEKIWKNIADALDESHIHEEFPSRLYNAEAVPPVSTWEKIAGTLDAESPAAIQIPKRNFPVLRYVAAAMVIGFVAFVVIKFTGKNNSGSDNQNEMASQQADTSSNPTDNNTHTN
ncbi:MAG TPA: hypothetical protein VI461_17075, partial [Chitinophagaceae bacterium]|nr:hypothetical protein [Chitinophagaceae bacterium]